MDPEISSDCILKRQLYKISWHQEDNGRVINNICFCDMMKYFRQLYLKQLF